MMVKNTRISTSSGPYKLLNEVFRGEESEEIYVVQGVEDDVKDMFRDALNYRVKRGPTAGKPAGHAAIHLMLSPQEATSDQQAEDIVRSACREYKVPFEQAVIVRHRKQREDNAGYEFHWHAILPHVMGNKVVDMEHNFARNEMLARMAEIQLGHSLVKGAHNTHAYHLLRERGLVDVAERMAHLMEGDPAFAAFSTRAHQTAKRVGIDMAHTKMTARKAAAETWSQADGGRAFVAAMAHRNLRIKAGGKAGVYMIEAQTAAGEWFKTGSVDRMALGDPKKRKDVAAALDGIDFDAVFEAARAPAESLSAAAPSAQGAAEGQAGEEWRAEPLPAGPVMAADPAEEDQHVNDIAASHTRGPRADQPGRDGGGDPRGPFEEEGRPESGACCYPACGDPIRPVAGDIGHREAGDGRPGTDPADRSAPGEDSRQAGEHRAAAVRARAREKVALGTLNRADPAKLDRLLDRVAAVGRVPLHGAPECNVLHRKISLAPWDIETADTRLIRRQRWLAAAVAKAYDLSWVPETVVVNLVRVDVDTERGAVILMLRSGTRLVDRQDRIDVVGIVDDITVDEIVEIVRRRGWDAVEVEGALDFRLAVASRLAVLEPPVALADSPLSDDEAPEIPAKGATPRLSPPAQRGGLVSSPWKR